MFWSGFFKFVLGVFTAIALIVGGGAIAAKIVVARFAAAPPKPMFPNDNKPVATKPSPRATPAAAKTETPDEDESEASKPLPPGAFQARVTQQIGLIVRDAPSVDGAQIGGVDFNAQVTVLETSANGDWQRIRLSNDREGWVKAGNVEKTSQ